MRDRPERRVLMIANPCAGAADVRRQVMGLADRLRAEGFQPEIAWTERAGHAVELAGAADARTGALVVCGGDGTLGEVLNGRPQAPLAILPLGNENLFARELGYRKGRPDRTLEALRTGRVRRMDLGSAGGRLFSTMAGIGLDAMVVDRVKASRRGHINRLFYVKPTLEAALRYGYPLLRVVFSDGRPDLTGGFVFIFNVAQYGGGLKICPEADGQDGLLDVCVFRGRQVHDFFRYIAAAAVGRHTHMPDFIHCRARQVRVEAEGPVRYQLDGDPGGDLPETFGCLAGAARFMVPA